ncbi:hypothetical protein GV791_14870 [Nocardia cyriacigeorgica]|uniref:Phage protein Gp19/Gp15/Gp42 n=1 Tax=Nocardia cyriacigeorgica TaxID=135487 RepID=A0A6P1CMZ5_9NOCA|nr:Gp19/Gp15/Gp42 family protein [Nocardia cyriacigeorgica]NEW33838.1 hypothetical protein [Nocardia cyriacigeorgica]
MAFATVDELEAGWRPLSQAEKDRATVLLDDAAWWLKVWFKEFGDLEALAAADEELAKGLQILSRNMVRRSMTTPVDGAGQVQQSLGPMTSTIAFRNPDGNLFVYEAERDAILTLLGVNTSGAVSMTGPGL